jgi:uncharacterized protein (DUF433 family)
MGMIILYEVGGEMNTTFERLTTNEAAIAAGVTVADINRAIDRKILPSKLYSTTTSRTLRKDACLWIAFYFETADYLTSAARLSAIRNGFGRCKSWTELKDCRIEESRTVEVTFSRIWEDVDRRLNRLKDAQDMVVEDPEIMSGIPTIRGTRIPVYDVAALFDAGTPASELLELYPRLKKEQFELASLYAKANPQRGRPKRKPFPKGTLISVTKVRLRDASLGGSSRGKDSDR